MNIFRRGTSLKVLGRLAGAAMVVAFAAGCGSVGSEQENIQPTDPTPGSGTSIRGTMNITPSTFTLTVKNGGTGAGAEFFFQLTGGKPPFFWNNSWPQMGQLTPIDELGRGYHTRALYEVRNFRGSGDDFITVRDSAGDVVTATFTKVIEAATAPTTTAPTVIPSTAAITCGGSIDLTASGGNGTFRWTTSNPLTTLRDPSTNAIDDSGTSIRLDTSLTAGCVAGSTVTVTVTSAGQTATAAITLNP